MIIFTRGCEIDDEDFDLIARLAVKLMLEDPMFRNRIFSSPVTFSPFGFILEKLILKYLIKHNAPENVISFIRDFSKAAQVIDDFFIDFSDPIDSRKYWKGFDYSLLDEENPIVEYLENQKQNKIKTTIS